MRIRWFLFVTLPVLVCALSGCGFLEYLGTPEGQRQAGGTAGAAGDVAANPANPIAWAKLLYYGGGLIAGYVAYQDVVKPTAKATASAVSNVVKKKVLNPEQPS